jgi:hypothetical protein
MIQIVENHKSTIFNLIINEGTIQLQFTSVANGTDSCIY